VATAIGVDELLLVLALTLVAVGMWQVWKPGAYLVPGLVLLWIVLPQRASWIARPPAAPSEKADRRTKGV
jgi:hypothetical protein